MKDVSDHDLSNWKMYPLNGATGQAFLGVRNDEKVFFKRNASPFTTTLSAEDIAPRLLWTQRTHSGDILTAQEWLDGELLSAEDMFNERVIRLIHRVHSTESLINVLRRAKGHLFKPLDFINEYYCDLPQALLSHRFFNDVVKFLEESIDDDFFQVKYVVCHGDLHHNNFLLSTDDQLYLVDWESVRIADPLSDITLLLCRYAPPSQWMDWFDFYQFPVDSTFYKRTQWYSIMSCLRLIKQYYLEGRLPRLNEATLLLRSIYEQAIQAKHRHEQNRGEFRL